MAIPPEIPWFAGTYGASCGDEATVPRPGGSEVWQELNFRLFKGGGWRPEEFRTFRLGAACMAVVGQCFAGDERIIEDARRAFDRDQLPPSTQWPGSHATIIVPPRRDQVCITTDLAGQYPIYFLKDPGGGTHFSSQASRLSRGASEDIDSLTLAAQLSSLGAPQLIENRSPYKNVYRLRAAQTLTIRDRALHQTTYEELATSGTSSPSSASEACGVALQEATFARTRLGRSISADLGGKDSSAVAFLLDGIVDRLPVLTVNNTTHPTDDLPFAIESARLASGFNLHVFDNTGIPMYGDMGTSPHMDLPYLGILAGGLRSAYFTKIKELRSELHLTGEGGDEIATAPSAYLADMLRSNEYWDFLRYGREVARCAKRAPLAVLRQAWHLSRTDLLSSFDGLALKLAHPPLNEITPLPLSLANTEAAPIHWLTRGAKNDVADLVRDYAGQLSLPDYLDIGNYLALTALRFGATLQSSHSDHAAMYGLRVQSPYYDNDVLRAAFSIPAWKRVVPMEYKAFLNHALKGRVPDQVLSRTTKGDYTNAGYAGRRRALPFLHELLQTSRLADMGVIEPSKINDTLDNIVLGEPVPMAQLTTWAAIELWLRRQDTEESYRAKNTSAVPNINLLKSVHKAEPLPSLCHTASFGLSEGTYAAGVGEGLMLLNLESQQYHRLDKTGSTLMALISNSSSLESALAALPRLYPDTDPELLHRDAIKFVHRLEQMGFLQEGAHRPLPTSTIEDAFNPPRLAEPAQSDRIRYPAKKETATSFREYAATVGATALLTAMASKPFRKKRDLIERLQAQRFTRDATEEEILRTLDITRRVSDILPGRIACLEESSIAALSLALQGRKVELHIGVATDPNRFHAWLARNGKPVTLRGDIARSGIFRTIVKVTAQK